MLAAFALGAICIVKKRARLLMAFLPVVAVFLTLMISTPVYAEFRYIYCLFTTLPFLASITFLAPLPNKNPANAARAAAEAAGKRATITAHIRRPASQSIAFRALLLLPLISSKSAPVVTIARQEAFRVNRHFPQCSTHKQIVLL